MEDHRRQDIPEREVAGGVLLAGRKRAIRAVVAGLDRRPVRRLSEQCPECCAAVVLLFRDTGP